MSKYSKYSCDPEFLRQNDNDLKVQYEELLCLRAQLARLLFPLKRSPPRKRRTARQRPGGSTGIAAK